MKRLLLVSLLFGFQVNYAADGLNSGSDLALAAEINSTVDSSINVALSGYLLGGVGFTINVLGAKGVFSDPMVECIAIESGAAMIIVGTSMFIYGVMKASELLHTNQFEVPAAKAIQSKVHQIEARPFSNDENV